MELKCAKTKATNASNERSNCTFMELKYQLNYQMWQEQKF